MVFGSGSSAGIEAIAGNLREAMKEEGALEQEARSRIYIVNHHGLLHSGRKDLTAEQTVYAQPEERFASWPRTAAGQIGLAEVIGSIDTTVRDRSVHYGQFLHGSKWSVKWPARQAA